MLWNSKWFPGTNLQDINLDWILKKISALRGGAAGQVLSKKTGTDFDFEWVSGGGGSGTTDYLELENKPSINSVELVGNKTAVELGLGTYSKPSGGIPKSDLASAVRTSLNKADTALQAGALPTGGAVGQIPVKKSAANYDTEWQYPQYSRPNLLDNWYFIGGGSQSGDGVFPMNQRGNAITTGYNVYPIDRWKMTGYASTQCELLATGLKLTNTSSSGVAGLRQYLPSIIPAGTKLTISALGVGGETFTNLAVRFYDSSNNNDSISTSQMVRDGELVYGSIELTRDCASVQFRVFPYATDFTFEAVKLELGDTQTLAHNEGTDESPVWVLNDLPNWFEELRKCQRYLQWIPSPYQGNFAPVGSGICWSTTSARISLSLPVPMIKTPTVTLQNANARLYIAGGSGNTVPSAIVAQTSGYDNANLRSILCLQCAIEGGITAAQAVLMISGTSNQGGILLSCED